MARRASASGLRTHLKLGSTSAGKTSKTRAAQITRFVPRAEPLGYFGVGVHTCRSTGGRDLAPRRRVKRALAPRVIPAPDTLHAEGCTTVRRAPDAGRAIVPAWTILTKLASGASFAITFGGTRFGATGLIESITTSMWPSPFSMREENRTTWTAGTGEIGRDFPTGPVYLPCLRPQISFGLQENRSGVGA
jgi:hypothetical protein